MKINFRKELKIAEFVGHWLKQVGKLDLMAQVIKTKTIFNEASPCGPGRSFALDFYLLYGKALCFQLRQIRSEKLCAKKCSELQPDWPRVCLFKIVETREGDRCENDMMFLVRFVLSNFCTYKPPPDAHRVLRPHCERALQEKWSVVI